jgi:hypothetical protein
MPVNIHGKEYRTVAERLELFHNQFKDVSKSIITEIVSNDENSVMMKTVITIEQDVYTGHAVEVYNSSMINKTSALENCETSSIGRALASAGFGGSEFASADEVTNAISQQKNMPKNEKEPQVNNVDTSDWNKGRENPINFGKYKGTKWKELPLDYLQWLADKSDNDNWRMMANAEVVCRVTEKTSEIEESEKALDEEQKGLNFEDDNDLPF